MPNDVKIAQLRACVDEGVSVEIDGVRVDVMTAAAILTVYERLPERTRRRFAAADITDMRASAWESLRREGTSPAVEMVPPRREPRPTEPTTTAAGPAPTGGNGTWRTIRLPAAPPRVYLELVEAWRRIEHWLERRATGADLAGSGHPTDRGGIGRALAESQAIDLVSECNTAIRVTGDGQIEPELGATERVWRRIAAFVEHRMRTLERARRTWTDVPALSPRLGRLRDRIVHTICDALS